MKSKIIALLLAAITFFCAYMVIGCGQNDDPPEDNDDYIDITYDEFAGKFEEFTVMENYINAAGYKFNLNQIAENDDIHYNVTINGNLGLDFEDISLSANIVAEYRNFIKEPSESSGGGNGTVRWFPDYDNKAIVNIYLYNHTLYMDLRENGEEIQKDSIKGINNDVTDIISDIIDNPDAMENWFGSDNDFNDLSDMMDYFKDYMQISYSEKHNHYIINVDYLQGGVYEGVNIDPFECTIDFIVQNNRIVELKFEYASALIKTSGSIREDNGLIEYPDDPDSYDGTILDELEEWLKGNDNPDDELAE